MYDDIPSYVEDFLYYIKTIKNRSNLTIREYHYDLKNFFKYVKKEKELLDDDLDKINITRIDLEFIQQITTDDINKYLAKLSLDNNDKPATIARKIASIKDFFNYICFKKKLVKINPTIDLETPSIGKRVPKYLTLDESIALLHSIDGKFKERDYAIITIFLNCGLRLSELISINLKDVSNRTLKIIGKGNKEREIYLNEACVSAIDNYLKVRPHENLKDSDALFITKQGTRISNRMVELIVKKYITLAGLDPKKYSPHKLRHTAATLMHKYGNIDIRTLQQILGHSSVSTTQIYTHVDNEQVKESLEKNPLNKSNI